MQRTLLTLFRNQRFRSLAEIRISSREDIAPKPLRNFRRLSYTRRCGWVGWGHAFPPGALQLKGQIDRKRSGFHLLDRLSVTLEGAPAYIICGEASVAESLPIWDEYLPNGIGAIKTRTTRPVLFAVREGVSSPADT